MKILKWSVVLCLAGFTSFHSPPKQVPSPETIQKIYREAETLFAIDNPTVTTDSLALTKYLLIAKWLEGNKEKANIRLNCYEKIGILKQSYGSYSKALDYYQKAIEIQRLNKLSDSLLFRPYLYSGNLYYQLTNFDSTIHFLKKAEGLLALYPDLNEIDRLYNSFGAIYYESGNYSQSINYFLKAIAVTIEPGIYKDYATYSHQNNIASALRHLHHFDSAASIYKKLVSLNTQLNQNYINQVYINLGTTYLEQSRPDSALVYLNLVKDPKQKNTVVFQNKLGQAYLQKEEYGKSRKHLMQSLLLHEKEIIGNNFFKDNNIGFTYHLLGDLSFKKGAFQDAIRNYQQSIIQLDYDFNDTSAFNNPRDYISGFSSFYLFESLVAKARCMKIIHEKNPDVKYLRGTIDTYRSAFRFANYILKLFDNENARLFAAELVLPTYKEAVAFLLDQYEQTRDQEHLEQAFYWAEKSKANALFINLRESEIKSFAGLPDSLLKKERNLKFALSRLFLQMDNAKNQEEIQQVQNQIRDNELALSRLQDRFHDYPEYFNEKFTFDSLNLSFIQEEVLDGKSALLSYFFTSHSLSLFMVLQDQLLYYPIFWDEASEELVQDFILELRNIEPGRPYQGSSMARQLYQKLLEESQGKLAGIHDLILIPHQNLNGIPFEALEYREGKYLIEKYSVTYQYAASLFQLSRRNAIDLNNTLVIAPFASGQATYTYKPLPSSETETRNLSGISLTNEKATKDNFMLQKDSASLIHLATHAVANSEHPSRSFIVFYPGSQQDEGNYKLYAQEIYQTSLHNTGLMFLSACETAFGKLHQGEGIMSLSRAFAYAGCNNLITSLWKAEDHTTAYISNRFYHYLEKGSSIAESLRRSKIDFLKSGEYAQFHKPSYWSHLVFIGNPPMDTPRLGSKWIVYLGGLVTVVLIWLVFVRKGRWEALPTTTTSA